MVGSKSKRTSLYSTFTKIVEGSMSLDQFGTEFAMNIEDGETGTKSKTGCLLTLILAVVTVAYTY